VTILFGLSAAFAWATSNVFLRGLSRSIDHRVTLVFVLLVATSIVVPTALIVDGLQGPFTPRSIAIPAVAAILGNVGFLLMLRAMRSGNISIVAPIIALEGGLAALIAIGFGERPNALQGLFLAVAVVGVVLVSFEPGKIAADGVLWALASASVYAVMFFLLGEAETPALTTAAIGRIAALATALPLLLLAPAAARSPRGSMRALLAAGLFDALGFMSFAAATNIGPTTIASVTSAQWATAVAIISIVVFRERLRANQYAGIAVTMIAVSGLALAH
jgi:drug/metabolite transporter (DMT)-like permease